MSSESFCIYGTMATVMSVRKLPIKTAFYNNSVSLCFIALRLETYSWITTTLDCSSSSFRQTVMGQYSLFRLMESYFIKVVTLCAIADHFMIPLGHIILTVWYWNGQPRVYRKLLPLEHHKPVFNFENFVLLQKWNPLQSSTVVYFIFIDNLN